MVGFKPQFAALVAAVSVSSASAAAVPQFILQNQLHQALSSRNTDHARRDVPIVPPPDKFKVHMESRKEKHRVGEHHRKHRKGKHGKGKGKKNHAEKRDSALEPRDFDGRGHPVAKVDALKSTGSYDGSGKQKMTLLGVEVHSPHKARDISDASLEPRDHDHHHHHGHHHHHHHDHDHHKRSPGPLRLVRQEDDKPPAKRALVNIGSGYGYWNNALRVGMYRSRPKYYYKGHGSLLHLNIGRSQPPRAKDVTTLAALEDEAADDSSDDEGSPSDTDEAPLPIGRRGLYIGHGNTLHSDVNGFVVSLGKRQELPDIQRRDPDDHSHVHSHVHSHDHDHDHDHHHHHHHHHHHGHHHHRRAEEGVEGVIDIMSPMVDNALGRKLASLILSSDPESKSAFVLNASNSTATHVFLVPMNKTSPADEASETMPVILRVPVYSPKEASMKDLCATYDPNPPSPAPLTGQMCTDKVSPHSSQIFSYNPTTGVIVPMWTVSPSSTDASMASEDPSTTNAAPSSTSPLPSPSPLSSDTTSTDSSASTSTSSSAPSKRSATSYVVQALETQEPCVDDHKEQQSKTASTMSDGASEDLHAAASPPSPPQTVSLVFTSLAAGVLPTKDELKPASTTFYPASNDEIPDLGAEDSEDDTTDGASALDSSEDNATPVTASTSPTTSESSTTTVTTSAATSPTVSQDAGSAQPLSTDGDEDQSDAAGDAFQPAEAYAVSPTSSSPLPSMTPVNDAASPYSWMFNPKV